MNNKVLSRDQQDAIDLLTGELQRLLDASLERTGSASRAAELQQQAEELDHFSEAAALIRLDGLAQAWRLISRNLSSLARGEDTVTEEQQMLLDSWPIYFLDYLQRLANHDVDSATVDSLSDFLKTPDWPEALNESAASTMVAALLQSRFFEQPADPVRRLPTIADSSLLSLDLNDDINPELFEGLMIELPGQVSSFADCIQHFTTTADPAQLVAAQRVAHTVKGSANVVGVSGLANFMHYSEDLLEEIARYHPFPVARVADLLTDMADTLATLLDCLLLGERPGAGELAVMQQVLDTYHRLSEGGIDALDQPLSTAAQAAPIVQTSATSTQDADPHVNAESGAATEPVSEAATAQPGSANLQETIASQLRIREETAQDLLRLAGSSAIATNRLQSQVQDVKQQLHHITQLHTKLSSLTEEFGQLIEVRNLFSQRERFAQPDGLDPLELERYNELHSFFHQLQEVVTDTRDAMQQARGQLRSLEEQAWDQQVTNRESQNLLLGMRMIPASNLEARFTRCVRQACRLTGKQAELVIEGGDTMIDSRALHDIIDPIMHLLRNAVGHGIEPPEQRIESGKPPVGEITLTFRSQGQSVHIDIKDDGAGLNYDAIRQRALALSIPVPDAGTPEENERWLNQLVFAPGFSTATGVDQTSGRGIGLDMVADRVSVLKGRVSLESHAGEGTIFSIRLPVTVIAEHGLLIRQGQHQWVVSSRGVEQLLYVDAADLEQHHDRWRYRFNEEWLDVYPIAALAKTADTTSVPFEQNRALIVVETYPGQRVAVLVESVTASREMVIKPLTALTPNVSGVIGATILGDGEIAPVLDVQHLLLEVLSEGFNFAEWRARYAEQAKHSGSGKPLALVVDDSLSTRRSLSQFVSDFGMDVCTAKDGFEAVDILQEKVPDIILVDMEMPRMNGLELTAHIRSNESTRHIPVVMITSRNTEKHRTLAEAAGVNNYLNKPFSEDELLQYLQASIRA